jgi:hypothetical protein
LGLVPLYAVFSVVSRLDHRGTAVVTGHIGACLSASKSR